MYPIEQLTAEYRHRELLQRAAEARRATALAHKGAPGWMTRLMAHLRTRSTVPSRRARPIQHSF